MSNIQRQKRICLVSGYIKREYTSLPEELVTLILIFYPYPSITFEGNVFNLKEEEMDLITSWFMRTFDLDDTDDVRFTSKLLYDNQRDGHEFNKKCAQQSNLFSIIETNYNGHLIGCFYSLPLGSKQGSHEDESAFLCVIRSVFIPHQSPKIYRLKEDKDSIKNAYNYHPECGPTFGRGFDLSVMDVYEKCSYSNLGNSCFRKLTGNELSGGIKYDQTNKRHKFEIKNMMTYTIQFTIG